MSKKSLNLHTSINVALHVHCVIIIFFMGYQSLWTSWITLTHVYNILYCNVTNHSPAKYSVQRKQHDFDNPWIKEWSNISLFIRQCADWIFTSNAFSWKQRICKKSIGQWCDGAVTGIASSSSWHRNIASSCYCHRSIMSSLHRPSPWWCHSELSGQIRIP